MNSLSFNSEDVRFLQSHQFGLRHLSHADQVTRELREGVHLGCSLSLIPPDKESLEKLEAGVEHFLDHCLTFDRLSYIDKPEWKVEDLVQNWVLKTHFILVYYKGENVVDPTAWGAGLGRFPKKDIDPSCLIPLPKFNLKELNLTSDYLGRRVTAAAPNEEMAALYALIVQAFKNTLVTKIRSLETSFTPSNKVPQGVSLTQAKSSTTLSYIFVIVAIASFVLAFYVEKDKFTS